jgi:Uma2 family endonuclease
MGQAAEQIQYFTKEQYLDMEMKAQFKSEYYNGEIFAMSGGSLNHSSICVNLILAIGGATRNKDCRVFESNMKLEIPIINAFVYPDVMVVCGKVEISALSDHVISNPVLIIEVLSSSTESFDRGKKFEYYQTLPSVKEYVLVSQDKPMVEVYFRQNEKMWDYSVADGIDKTVFLQSIDHEIRMKDIYLKIFG